MEVSHQLTRDDDELIRLFGELSSAGDVAALLEVPLWQLNFILYTHRHRYQYTRFEIPKRSGGVRQIASPPASLAILQKKLCRVLQLVYRPRGCVHGFVRDRSIATNARLHVGRPFVLNVDLADFFTTIHFGRVRGMLMAPPYGVAPAAATVLAHLACDGGHLPQGGPSSPVLSNMVCRRMDSELTRLARRFRCRYTRYADDITLSTTRSRFPAALATRLDEPEPEDGDCLVRGTVTVGPALRDIIEDNGFDVNPQKVRLQHSGMRQEVTGVVVNTVPNTYRRHTRQVRAMVHALGKYGPDNAAADFATRYDPKRRPAAVATFRAVLLGKLEFIRMIKGGGDSAYRGLVNRLHHAQPGWIEEAPPEVKVEDDRDWTFWHNEWKTRVFHLEVEDQDKRIFSGSGVRIGRSLLLTAAHNVAGMKRVSIICPGFDDRTALKTTCHPDADAGIDAAVLEVDFPAGLRSHPPSRQTQLPAPGTQLAALGFPKVPFRLPECTITPGHVEATSMDFHGAVTTIQVSMPLSGGNSGGPVIDRGGNLVGIVSELTTEDAEDAPRSFSHVLPIRHLRDLLR